MANQESSTLVGCLLDVSGSMRKVLETGRSDSRAIGRFHAVLGAALNIARREQQNDSKAKMFVGAFGLDRQAGYPSTVDLCAIIEALCGDNDDGVKRSGHALLIEIANEHNLAHITKYIRTKLTDGEARIVHAVLQRHPERISEFIAALPCADATRQFQEIKDKEIPCRDLTLIVGDSSIGGPAGELIRAGGRVAAKSCDKLEDWAADFSKGLHLARRICREWFQDFVNFVPRPVGDVVQLLQKLQRHSTEESMCLSDTIGQFMYGDTPLCDALSRSLSTFCTHRDLSRRVLMLMSDGHGNDGDPSQIASQLHSESVFVAGAYLTSDHNIPQKCLYDHPANPWDKGQRTLFNIASKVSANTHPIPVMMSAGWQVPCSGEVALYVSVCTEAAVEEFCSLLVSAHLGSTDALLDIVGRLRLDKYINDSHVITCNKPSDQGNSATCYAHAIAAVIHMALLRIERKDTCPTIEEIRERILQTFPPGDHGHATEEVLSQVVGWYRLRYEAVDEMRARQAVLLRRPVLTSFRLTEEGWKKFSQHFSEPPTQRSILTEGDMRQYRKGPDDGGHAVVLYACDPHSLSFLNSWGSNWGVNGSFRVQSPASSK